MCVDLVIPILFHSRTRWVRFVVEPLKDIVRRSFVPRIRSREPDLKLSSPYCGEMLAYVNPRNNLAHCFACRKNFNNIDLLLALDHDFPSAVTLLERWLEQYQAQRSRNKRPDPK